MNIKITADSTCDLPQALLVQHDITMIPLSVVKDGAMFTDGIDITPADIFAHVAAGGSLCTTAAVNIETYHKFFEEYSSQYDAVIHVNIGSEFSCSYQNACIAASEFSNVRVIDSCNLSNGQGLVVLKARELSNKINDLEEICQKTCEYTGNVEMSFVLDRLEYMVKGGRCSTATALGANLLNLKPCIEVKEGKMTVVKKYRGNYSKCLINYMKDRLQGRDDLDRSALFVINTPIPAEAKEAVENFLTSVPSFDRLYRAKAGCTISCHCGPGTLGIAFARK